MRRIVSDLAAAWLLLLRIPCPIPPRWHGHMNLADSAWAYPLIGALTGLWGGVVYFVCDRIALSGVASAGLALAAIILITGALHEDGFADFWDSFGGQDKARRLEIMRDSRIGTFGTIGLIMSVGLRWSAMTTFSDVIILSAVLIAAGALSRAICLVIMRFLNTARSDGLGASASGLTLPVFLLGCGIAVVISLLIVPVVQVLHFVAAIVVISVLMCWFAKSRFGGYTGDVLGAGQQFGEIMILILAASFFS